LFIIYGILAETSIGDLFISGILPGLLLSSAYVTYILIRAYWFPKSIIAHEVADEDTGHGRSLGWYIAKLGPVVLLIFAVMGGIYGGVFTPTEAGGVGALVALLISLAKRKLDWRGLWRTLVETGHVTASIGLIIIAAHVYARMLAVAGVPKLFSDVLVGAELGLYGVLALYVALVIVLGTIIDAASIMLICVPLFLPVVLAFGADIVWFGVITVLAVEIGMLTPPFGIAVFVIRNNLRDAKISLNDIFAGAAPFAVIMLLVLILIIAFPWFSLGLIR
jgi:tripartite ATP-independent transporter DctM subunit